MNTSRRAALVLACLTLLGPARSGRGDDAEKPKGGGPAELQGLKFRLLGPNAGGRVSRAAGVPGDPLTYYAATASGGVWKSVDGGTRWAPIFDDQPIASIGSIAVSPSNPNVVYVGSGEANIRGNVAPGNGIYKSADGGKTWALVWKQEGQIGTMIVHPQNPDVAFAAVLGHAFGPNPERGVYRTRDGGKTWQKVLAKNSDTGASDVCFDPQNPNVLFAGLWQARRRPWELSSGGPGSGLFTSRDGGDTWKRLEGNGLPEGVLGKIGVAVAPSDSRRVYALIEAAKGGLYRSDDGGDTWSRVNDHHALSQRAWYYSTLAVDPANPDVVWFPQVPLLKTIDGGKTVKRVPGIRHGDNHDMWIDPKNPRRLILANDGGVEVSVNGGETWRAAWLPISQFYHVAADNSVPYRVSGAMQDLGTAWGPTDSLDKSGIRVTDWYGIGGGEAGHTAHDPADPGVAYAGEYLGIFTRYDNKTRQARNVSPYPNNLSGHGIEDGRYRFQWTAPIHVSPHDGKTVYYGGNVVFRTRDGGQSWDVISPDLTRNDKAKQKWTGGEITGDNTGVEHYCTVFALAESPREKGLLWAGSDDGLVHVSRDDGAHWTNVTQAMPGFPEWGTVSLIEPSPHDAGTAYVVVKNHRMDDLKPYLWKTADYGKTWKRLGPGLPADVFLHAVREDPVRKGLLYLGTERGLMYSTDDGATFTALKLNLPTVAVHDMVVKATISSSPPTAAPSGSSATSRCCGPFRPRSRRRTRTCLRPPPPRAGGWASGGGARRGWARPPSRRSRALFPEEEARRRDRARSPRRPGDRRAEAHEQARALRMARGRSRRRRRGQAIRAPRRRRGQRRGVGPDPGRGRAHLQGPPRQRQGQGRPPGPARPLYRSAHRPWAEPDGPPGGQARPPGGLDRGRSPGADGLRSRSPGRPRPPVPHGRADPLGARAAPFALRAAQGQPGGLRPREGGGRSRPEVRCPRRPSPQPHRPDLLRHPGHEGGTQLYSKLAPLYTWAHEADGRPTQGMKEMAAEHRQELDRLTSEWSALVSGEIAALNTKARELNLGFVLVGSGR